MREEKLYRIRSYWRRLAMHIFVACLSFIARHASPRARVHWLGRHHRPRRPERMLLVTLLFFSMAIFEPREYMLWSVTWGGALSIFVTLNSIYLLLPRKRAHWVKL